MVTMGVRRRAGHHRCAALIAAAATSLLGAGHTPSAVAAAPPPQPPPQLTQAKVDDAVGKLDDIVRDAMRRTGVPGVAVAVVHKGRVVHLKGFGERRVGRSGAVDPDTVFQLASLSKPLASTVVAGVVGGRTLGWDDPVAAHLPGFALKDPWVTTHVTYADLFSHRSGLPDHSGDLLEDLGYDRTYILDHLKYEPLGPFRASYAYTNYGVTAAAQAVANAKDTSWDKLSQDTLYGPAGMKNTSSRFSDYDRAKDKAVTHVKNADGTWQPKYVRDADAQSPAGGASSTARDMATWMRLQLANGKLDGRQIIPAAPLERTHLPEIVAQPPQAPAGRAGFYGLGWNVGYDDQGRLRLSHSGAFELGANTNVTMLPGEQLGITVLTNGAPVGLADSVALNFFDIAQHGKPTTDWLPLVDRVYRQQEQQGRSPTDYARPPRNGAVARAADRYTGTYDNAYYGPLTVTAANGELSMSLGPKHTTFRLTHYDGDTFAFRTVGENATGLSGVTFEVGPGSPGSGGSKASRVTVEAWDHDGLGTFTRR
ncbi:serine hydrolase [Streptomyces mirabilis]|uniref:Serine hydrolase n=2 Tax=Streptomyces mirabilis TaxID=68239 RepID=A0ABU3UET1_9ACTN|nr:MULTISPECIES: serine hydrolase [Streptomyces]MCX4613867.1 serine hydrolase [Streptomyces mirabilis]MCX5353994.1 serine hydrolase [Streptomyces mirabilis]MDU8992433.1 serine hydrolase [Streptomyces mirabilis]QDN82022.1 serine hydrolase [Streptomyces sp. S1A1-7]QDN91902.1 serine hydrolase [Streptomyces sp. RLB3-6]